MINKKYSFIFIFLTLISFAYGSLTDGLIAYYSLENNAEDNTTNNQDGTLIDTPTYTTGKVNGGYDFDTTDSIDFGVNAWQNIESTDSYTICSWFKVDNLATYRVIWSKTEADSTYYGIETRISSTGAIETLTGDTNTFDSVTSSNIIATDNWYFICFISTNFGF